jgi:hypothetical protein
VSGRRRRFSICKKSAAKNVQQLRHRTAATPEIISNIKNQIIERLRPSYFTLDSPQNALHFAPTASAGMTSGISEVLQVFVEIWSSALKILEQI